MLQTLKDTLSLLNEQEKQKAALLFFLVLLSAMIETLGVASIMPFLAVLANPDLIQSQPLLHKFYTLGDFQDPRGFLMALGVLVFLIMLFSNGVSALLQWAMSRFTYMRSHSVAIRLLNVYLSQPYEFFLKSDSSEMAHSVLTEVMHVVKNVVVAGMELISRLIVSVFMIGLLVFVNPELALYVGGGFALAYTLLYLVIHKKLSRLGNIRITSGEKKFREFKEIFSSLKEMRLAGAEQYFLRGFRKASLDSADSLVKYDIISVLPKYCLELLAFGGGILILLYLLAQNQDMAVVLPTIGVYALAGQRLMPAMRSIFICVSKIHYARSGLENIVKQLSLPLCEAQKTKQSVAPIIFARALSLENINFSYTLEDCSKRQIFKDLNLVIPKNKIIGFVGGTGAGKSTLMDILMGLLPMSSGVLRVDDRILGPEDIQEWRRHISYVPQRMALLNDTVINNITFGVEPDHVDEADVIEALKMTQMYDFVKNEMPGGLHTEVGENGVRLSGGQRQRLGLARALYRKATILILDEATSALDNVTEKTVIDSILQSNAQHSQDRTVLMIAHRLSTLRNCDTIHYLDHGRIIASGRYETLIETSPEFKQLVKATEK